MFEKPNSLLLDELVHHIAEDGPDGIEALVCLADVLQTEII